MTGAGQGIGRDIVKAVRHVSCRALRAEILFSPFANLSCLDGSLSRAAAASWPSRARKAHWTRSRRCVHSSASSCLGAIFYIVLLTRALAGDGLLHHPGRSGRCGRHRRCELRVVVVLSHFWFFYNFFVCADTAAYGVQRRCARPCRRVSGGAVHCQYASRWILLEMLFDNRKSKSPTE